MKLFESMLVIGIDPGVNGAMATGAIGQGPFETYKLPENQEDTWEIFNSYAPNLGLVVVERISPRPEQALRGVVTSCTRYGWLQMMLLQPKRHWDVRFCTAVQWQKALGLTRTWKTNKPVKNMNEKERKAWEGKRYRLRKKLNKDTAKKLFPSITVTNTNADALLICRYAEQLYRPPYGRD